MCGPKILTATTRGLCIIIHQNILCISYAVSQMERSAQRYVGELHKGAEQLTVITDTVSSDALGRTTSDAYQATAAVAVNIATATFSRACHGYRAKSKHDDGLECSHRFHGEVPR